jgi:solute carrier family 24 (sodium/potassium/calcium exchanger), member 2
MFVSFLGLFVAHSSVGLGTIVGSNIFNHMIISAGSVMSAKAGKLKLDPKVLTRESVAYLSSSLMLVWALKGATLTDKANFNPSHWYRCLSVGWPSSLALVTCYVIYGLVAANFNKICVFLCGSAPESQLRSALSSTSEHAWSSSDRGSGLELHEVHIQESFSHKDCDTVSSSDEVKDDVAVKVNIHDPSVETSSLHVFEIVRLRPASENDDRVCAAGRHAPEVYEHGPNEFANGALPTAIDSSRFSRVAALSGSTHLQSGDEDEDEADDHILTLPRGRWSRSIHYAFLPLKYILHWTIPRPVSPHGSPLYGWTMTASIVWLALLAEVMLLCMQGLGSLLGISPLVLGLTVSAVGTSLPNLWSSLIVAREGNGNMAISNALGSNTFNIYIGLGIPWLTYTLATGRELYIEDGGIIVMTLILIAVLLVFYLLVVLHDWELRYWMGPLFIFVYAAVMTVILVLF